MMRGGVRLSTFLSHVNIYYSLHATWHLHPATMHGGVQCICPAMHGGGAKRVRFKKKFKPGLNLKFVSNLG
jgi:hypothetical protein